MMELTNKVIIITGGYGHLGSGIVKGLIDHDAIVIVFARSIDKFNKLKDEINNTLNLYFEYCDISTSDSLKAAYHSAFEKFSKIDVVINNAMFSKGISPETLTDEMWDFGIDGTLSSVFKSIREVIPYMKNLGGSIINISSMYGVIAPDFDTYKDAAEYLNPPHYGAAKAGVIQLTRYYASFLGKYNIRVNAITPGPFPSVQVQKNKEFVKQLEKRTLLNRIGKPEDLVGISLLLSSSYSEFITGQNIIVDGGWTAK